MKDITEKQYRGLNVLIYAVLLTLLLTYKGKIDLVWGIAVGFVGMGLMLDLINYFKL